MTLVVDQRFPGMEPVTTEYEVNVEAYSEYDPLTRVLKVYRRAESPDSPGEVEMLLTLVNVVGYYDKDRVQSLR